MRALAATAGRHLRRAGTGAVLVWSGAVMQPVSIEPVDDAARAATAQAEFRTAVARDAGMNDPEAAFPHYQEAAMLGDAQAAFDLAAMLGAGRGTARDPVAAARWFAEAAVRGEVQADAKMAEVFQDGVGVPLNAALARRWASASASRGAPEALTEAVPPDGEVNTMASPVPAAPADGDVLRAGAQSIALIWDPGADDDATYQVELAVREDGSYRRVWEGSSDISAVLTRKKALPGRYAWRVLAVNTDAGHYLASDWVQFSIK